MTPLKNYFAMSLEQLQLTIKYCTNVLFFNKQLLTIRVLHQKKILLFYKYLIFTLSFIITQCDNKPKNTYESFYKNIQNEYYFF